MTVEQTGAEQLRDQDSTIQQLCEKALKRGYTPDESWGELTEQYDIYLKGRGFIPVDIYRKPSDIPRWNLFTTVDRRTGEVINAELSLN